MLPRFCELCFKNVHNSLVIRRFSVQMKILPDTEYSKEFVEEDENKNKKKKMLIVKCKNTDLDFYLGHKFSKFNSFPLASRGWSHRKSKGDYFTIYPLEKDGEQLNNNANERVTFSNFKLNKQLIKNLENLKIIHPTEIQNLGIPEVLSGSNTILTAETGCGKTLAYLLPLLQQIHLWKSENVSRKGNTPLALIITPSQELSHQIHYLAKLLCKGLEIESALVVAGRTMQRIYNPTVKNTDLIIATLGTMHKLTALGIYNIKSLKHVVLDEADTLFEETFCEKLRRFLSKVPFGYTQTNKQTPDTTQMTLTSATMPQNLPDTLNEIVNTDSFKSISTGNVNRIYIPQKFLRLGQQEKPMTLLKLVKQKSKNKIPIIIFSNNIARSKWISIFLKKFNVPSVHMNGKMRLPHRKRKFYEFRSGRVNVLSTTDAGARGLDTITARYVINYDFPLITSEYIHRCGRVGRVGSPKDCRAINFISRAMEIILTKRIETAARKMKPIPIVDMIHKDSEEDDESEVNEVEVDEDKETSLETIDDLIEFEEDLDESEEDLEESAENLEECEESDEEYDESHEGQY